MRSIVTVRTDDFCSCAHCMGVEPWRSLFAQCIQVGWHLAGEAVALGLACRVPIPEGSEQ